MIYTVTLSPSLDYTLALPKLCVGDVNRAEKTSFCVGGKGINVSIVLNNLGQESIALGFTAGFTGREIERLFAETGCKSDFIRLKDGLSRVNVSVNSDVETKLNAGGPNIPVEALELLLQRLDGLSQGDILVLSGSVPSSIPADIYSRIMLRLEGKKLSVVVDATGDELLSTLHCHPFLIKPNHHELGEFFGLKLETKDEIVIYAKKLQERGARNILISMAGDGAVLVKEGGEVSSVFAPKGKLVNSVGAGDSMVAGFLKAFLQYGNLDSALAMGVAAGSATAFSEKLADGKEILDEFTKMSCN